MMSYKTTLFKIFRTIIRLCFFDEVKKKFVYFLPLTDLKYIFPQNIIKAL